MARVILLTGFEPFGGEKTNPSWEVASRFDEMELGGARVEAMRLPVNCRRASRKIAEAIAQRRPAAVLGLGQAGGRAAISLEKVALNLADEHAKRETFGGLNGKPVMPGGPDAYFSRLRLAAIMRALKARGIPAELSLSAGVYVCNTAMYAALHALRSRRRVQAGFIHLPYEAAQASRHRSVASMSLELMASGIETALKAISRGL
jgi:pyroglutamyl-peptidase